MANLKEELQAIHDTLDKYEESIGLPSNTIPGEIEEFNGYLNMSRDRIEKLMPSECNAIAFRLGRYCLYLQRLQNRENAALEWANTKLVDIVSSQLNSYNQYMKYENKLALISKENSTVEKLLQFISNRKQKLATLDGVSHSIQYMARILEKQYSARATEIRKDG